MSGKRKAISRPMRSVRSKSMTHFLCNNCNQGFKSIILLENHKKSSHSNLKPHLDITTPGLPIIDDISLMDLTVESASGGSVELEENCQINPTAAIKANSGGLLELEETCQANPATATSTDSNMARHYKCSNCDYTALPKDDVEKHSPSPPIDDMNAKPQSHTYEIDKLAVNSESTSTCSPATVQLEVSLCPFCKMAFKNNEMLKRHIENIHFKKVVKDTHDEIVIYSR